MAIPFIGNDIWNTELNQERLNQAMQARQQAQLQQGLSQLGGAVQQWKNNNIANTLMNQQSPPVAQPVAGPNGESPDQVDAIRAQAFQNPAAFSAQYSAPGSAPGSDGFAPAFNPAAPSSAQPATGGVAQLQLQGQQNALAGRSALLNAQTQAAQGRLGVEAAQTGLWQAKTAATPQLNLNDPSQFIAAGGAAGSALYDLNTQKTQLQNFLSAPNFTGQDTSWASRQLANVNGQIQAANTYVQAQVNRLNRPGSQANNPNDPTMEVSMPQTNGTTARLKIPASQAGQYGVTLPTGDPIPTGQAALPQGYGPTPRDGSLFGQAAVPTFQQRVNTAPTAFATPPDEVSGIVPNGAPLSTGTAYSASGNGGDPYAAARLSIANGADPAVVKARLQQNGLDPNQL